MYMIIFENFFYYDRKKFGGRGRYQITCLNYQFDFILKDKKNIAAFI